MRNVRLMARSDIKAPNLIKGIRLEGLRVTGDPYTYAKKYYEAGVDEILYMDIVASLYGRNNLSDIIEHTARDIFIPITVGGGIRSAEDAKRLLRSGADKVAINTAATERPEVISEIAEKFGSQCMVISIEAKRKDGGGWEAYTDNGREHTHRDVLEWVVECEKRGAGEVLLTSVDNEGTRKGFDVELVQAVTEAVKIPVIASGGMGELKDVEDVVKAGRADAVAIADGYHYDRFTVDDVRKFSLDKDIPVRSL